MHRSLRIQMIRSLINCCSHNAVHSPQNDDTAHDKFLKITRAYEVLKDEDLRKKYDKYGEKGLDEQQSGRYESWNFYRYDFGKCTRKHPFSENLL